MKNYVIQREKLMSRKNHMGYSLEAMANLRTKLIRKDTGFIYKNETI